MYYLEEIINGVLMYKTSPNGEWRPVSDAGVLDRMKKSEDKVYLLRHSLEECINVLLYLKTELPSFETEIRGKIDKVLNGVTQRTIIDR